MYTPEDRRVVVVQRGHRLGGKGASHRGIKRRIEEHGLHVWLGYYDNAFRMMREIYEQLDRPASHPIATVDDAFLPSDTVGVLDHFDGHWMPWMAEFRRNAELPGGSSAPATLPKLAERAASLLADLASSVTGATSNGARRRPDGIVLRATPPGARTGDDSIQRLYELAEQLRRFEAAALVGAVQLENLATLLQEQVGSPLPNVVVDAVVAVRNELRQRMERNREARRLWQAVDLVSTSLIGIYVDRLLESRNGYASINHLDFRQWLERHGADPATLDGALVRGMYDLVFAYEQGDRPKPAFEAGTGLLLASRFFFDYKGSLFWKMRAGMGEIVFAPLYQCLRERGTEFEFFHRLSKLRLDDSGRFVEAIELVRQVDLQPGLRWYEPLVDVDDLPCFPEWPIAEQLATSVLHNDLETHAASGPAEHRVELRRGEDFDDVVLAVSLGMIPHTCKELLDADARWRAMIDNVGTVATQALQVWTTPTEQEMGWANVGSTVSGYTAPFDTYASMSHLLEHEDWRADPPAAVSYFCSALQERQVKAGASDAVDRNATEFLDQYTTPLWPRMQSGHGGFRWDQTKATYSRANADPSDRYVQSLPGSSAYRMAADESGFENLYLAGDWIDSGLNAGCIEAAVIAGRQAANALAGRDLHDGIHGGWTPTRAEPHTGSDGG